MNAAFAILCFQVVVGAFDNFWHHELEARLPQRRSARHELQLHAMREALYGVLFMGVAWLEWHGIWAWTLALLLALELCITLADFLEEDRSRKLPPLERILHTVLAVSFGAFAAVFGAVLWRWSQWPTGLTKVNYGWVSVGLSASAVGVWLWSARNAMAVRQLQQLVLVNTTPPRRYKRHAAAVLVTGGTGFIGSAVVASLRATGKRVVVLTRDAMQAKALLGTDVWVVDSLDQIPSETRLEAVVHLAGATVLGLPWTRARRATLLSSRTTISTQLLALMRRLEQPPRVLVQASAVGYYGVPADCQPLLTEDQPPQGGRFQSDLCAAIEHEALRAQALGVRVVNLRFGIVLGSGGGAYPGLAMAARLGLGAVLGTGEQPVPWAHLRDAVGLVQFALQHANVHGAVNAVAPNQLRQAEFARTMARAFGRSVWLRMPAAPLRWLLGEMSELLLEGQNVVPAKALAEGYCFQFPSLESAMANLAGRPASHRVKTSLWP